jgi:Flp pilus assembly protein TadB
MAMSQSYSSPLSFVGSARRLIAWAERTSGGMAVVAWTSVAIALPCVWLFLIGWYIVVFGIFGVITIPLRLLRRHQRKELAVQQQQLEALQKLAKP